MRQPVRVLMCVTEQCILLKIYSPRGCCRSYWVNRWFRPNDCCQLSLNNHHFLPFPPPDAIINAASTTSTQNTNTLKNIIMWKQRYLHRNNSMITGKLSDVPVTKSVIPMTYLRNIIVTILVTREYNTITSINLWISYYGLDIFGFVSAKLFRK